MKLSHLQGTLKNTIRLSNRQNSRSRKTIYVRKESYCFIFLLYVFRCIYCYIEH